MQRMINSLERMYSDCTDYKSVSGCNKSKLGCSWDSSGSKCLKSGGSGTGGTGTSGTGTGGSGTGGSGTGGSGAGPTAWMKDNDWVLQIKLGTGGNNCTESNGAYSCHYLYASSTEPALKLITDHRVDEENTANPAYQFYLSAKEGNNKFVSWNDQGSTKSCVATSGAAHDKGSVVYELGSDGKPSNGVYLQSSNPFWGFWDQGFLSSCDDAPCVKSGDKPLHPGIQTDLAQHLLFVKVPTATDMASLAKLMSNANLCAIEGSLPGFEPCYSSCPVGKDYMESQVGAVSIIAKPRGERGDDVWSHLNKTVCNDQDISVLSYCSPPCPDKSKKAVPGVTDVINTHHGKSLMNTDCLQGEEFDPFHMNHSKMGVCCPNANADCGEKIS